MLLLLLLLLWRLPLFPATTIGWLSDALDCGCDTFIGSLLRAVGDNVPLAFEISSDFFLLSKIILLSRTLNFPAELSLLASVFVAGEDLSVK